MSVSHSRRPGVASSAKRPGPADAQASLRLQQKPERLAALMREHQQLLAKIRQKKGELRRLAERLDTTLGQMARSLQPVVSQIEQRDEELHALFAALLARKRQPRSITAAIRRVYQILQETQILSRHHPAPRDPAAAEAEEEPEADFFQAEDGVPPPKQGGFTAQRPVQGPAGQSLRGLFHRLVGALHPDSVQHEEEKARRTEAMKELTRAYKDGDLARLLELERIWLVNGATPAVSDELDQRCATLLRTNVALQSQLDQIKKELKELRRSPSAEVLSDVEQEARRTGTDPVAAAVSEAQQHLDRLGELVSFVGSFRDGVIGLDDFLAGPPSNRKRGESYDFADPLEIDDFLDSLFGGSAKKSSPRRKGRRGPSRTGSSSGF